jgi:uridine kinase
MNVALIIAGYLRSFKDNLPLLKSNLIDSFDEVDIYIHITLDEERDDKYFNKSELEDILYIEKELRPKACLIEGNLPLSNKQNFNALKNTWIKYFKLNAIKKINEQTTGQKYDLVIKSRPDTVLLQKLNISQMINKVVIPDQSLVDTSKLRSPKDPYICDIFAYGPSVLMDQYFDFYLDLDALAQKYSPISESLLARYLDSANIPYTKKKIKYSVILSKCNVIAIAGDSSSGKSTLAELLKKFFFSNSFILEGDRYHKWERNSVQWSHTTHLDPKANFLSKLEEDVFNLKIGKSIYQVDYDHQYGKFTSPEIINPNENLIVCGLHPLISNKSNIYDLKIYIEADPKLKKHWHVTRDVAKRGKSQSEVLEQINSRKVDYENYIKPQRNNADMIITFLSGERSQSLESLRLLITKKYSINQYIFDLSSHHIAYTLITGDDYHELFFEKYTQNTLFEEKLINENEKFYDYILLAIKNIYG